MVAVETTLPLLALLTASSMLLALRARARRLRCYYYRSGFIQGSCPYCQCSPDEDERGEMDRQPGGGTRVEDDDMERGLALEGYWGF